MPLSEDEQRILQDIERAFYEQDPKFANAVTNPPSADHAVRNCRLAAVGFFVGLVFLGVMFTVQPAVGFLGFLVMVASAAWFLQNMLRMQRSKHHEPPAEWLKHRFLKDTGSGTGTGTPQP